MGPSTSSMAENFPLTNRNTSRKPRYPLWMARSIFRQTLLGLDYLHKDGIAHGDIQPRNLPFPVKDLKSVDETQLLQQHVGCSSSAGGPVNDSDGPNLEYPYKRAFPQPVKRIVGKVDHWAPRYLSYNQFGMNLSIL